MICRKLRFCLILLGLVTVLAGCDKCGDHWFFSTGTPHNCKDAEPLR